MRLRTWIALGVILAAAALFAIPFGCSSAQTMQSGYRVPASEATVNATEGDNGNTRLEIRVKHLAQPSQVSSDAKVYVVWVRPANGSSQNVGALALNEDLEGTLDTVTPHRQFLLSVTPEANGQVAGPTHQPVFTANVDRSN